MNIITIYGRPGCGYCSRAIHLCEQNQFEYNYIDIWAEGISKDDLAKKTGKPVYTVPQIFHGEKHVGGCDDFEDFLAAKVELTS